MPVIPEPLDRVSAVPTGPSRSGARVWHRLPPAAPLWRRALNYLLVFATVVLVVDALVGERGPGRHDAGAPQSDELAAARAAAARRECAPARNWRERLKADPTDDRARRARKARPDPAGEVLVYEGCEAVVEIVVLRVAHSCAEVLRLGFPDAGWSSPVARWAHNPKVAGSNPAPATITTCTRGRPFLATSSLLGGAQHRRQIPSQLDLELALSRGVKTIASMRPRSASDGLQCGCLALQRRRERRRPSGGRGRPCSGCSERRRLVRGRRARPAVRSRAPASAIISSFTSTARQRRP